MRAAGDQSRPLGRGIRRIRADNPSPMTGTGTNTYLIDTEEGVVVIDPGPDLPQHFAAILSDLGSTPVAAILVSHAHLDHSALAARLARQTSAPVLAFGRADDGRSPTMQALAGLGMTDGGEGIDRGFVPDLRVGHGELLRFGAQTIEVLHCPGHMGGHLCFALGDTVFSGDHVMGWASTLISPPDGDMTDYMLSLALLAARQSRCFLPGHGEAIAQPRLRLAELAAHRHARETAIMTALATGQRTVKAIAARVYRETPAALQAAAARNVLAHLIDLHGRNLISCIGQLGPEGQFQAV